jgi:hypothetical protein
MKTYEVVPATCSQGSFYVQRPTGLELPKGFVEARQAGYLAEFLSKNPFEAHMTVTIPDYVFNPDSRQPMVA